MIILLLTRSIWKDYKNLKKKVLTKALEGEATPGPEETPVVDSILDTPKEKKELFNSQAGQNSVVYSRTSSLAGGTVLFNNA